MAPCAAGKLGTWDREWNWDGRVKEGSCSAAVNARSLRRDPAGAPLLRELRSLRCTQAPSQSQDAEARASEERPRPRNTIDPGQTRVHSTFNPPMSWLYSALGYEEAKPAEPEEEPEDEAPGEPAAGFPGEAAEPASEPESPSGEEGGEAPAGPAVEEEDVSAPVDEEEEEAEEEELAPAVSIPPARQPEPRLSRLRRLGRGGGERAEAAHATGAVGEAHGRVDG